MSDGGDGCGCGCDGGDDDDVINKASSCLMVTLVKNVDYFSLFGKGSKMIFSFNFLMDNSRPKKNISDFLAMGEFVGT